MLSQLLAVYTLVAQLFSGVLALKPPGVKVTMPQAASYAVAAGYHGLVRGIDPWELIALARNESDFVENLLGPDGKDCGLTQTRVTVTKYTCKDLRRSAWLAFKEAARELDEFKRSCKKHDDFDRCRLNRYNSGYRYAKTGVHGAYWLRVQCFAEAARAGVPVGQACRNVRTPNDISRVIDERRLASFPAGESLAKNLSLAGEHGFATIAD